MIPVLIDPFFDDVREAQRAYRQILDAFAWPGKINPLPPTNVQPPTPWSAPLVQVTRTLLDATVTFAVRGDAADALERYLVVNTGARLTESERAEYVLVGHPLTGAEVRVLSAGSLTAPEEGATLIVACGHLGATERPGSVPMALRGRGIHDERRLYLELSVAGVLQAVAAREDEYPLGVDVILVASDGQIASLPRTTRWRKGVPQWAT